MAQNQAIFKEKTPSPEIIAAQGINILSHFPWEKGSGLLRFIDFIRLFPNFMSIECISKTTT
jgi:hypothetical protein